MSLPRIHYTGLRKPTLQDVVETLLALAPEPMQLCPDPSSIDL